MTFAESIRVCFAKYADFSGSASRPEFWWWTLFTLIASLALEIVDDRLSLVFVIATVLPSLSVATRRLHDVGRSGWWQLVGLVPLIGWVVMIVWLAQPSKGIALPAAPRGS